jgi:hypothetical protein
MKNFIAWVEIPSTNFVRAVSFYENVLKLSLKSYDFGSEKMAHLPNDEGAIIYSEGYTPSKNGVLVSLNVGDQLDETIALIQKNGGSIIKERTKIEAEGRDFFAVFLDCEGNRLGLYGK